MPHLTRLRLTLALGVWVALLLLFLLGGNLWPPEEGPARKPRIADSMLLTACLAGGFLLMPVFPLLGGGAILVACGMVLISSVRRASR